MWHLSVYFFAWKFNVWREKSHWLHSQFKVFKFCPIFEFINSTSQKKINLKNLKILFPSSFMFLGIFSTSFKNIVRRGGKWLVLMMIYCNIWPIPLNCYHCLRWYYFSIVTTYTLRPWPTCTMYGGLAIKSRWLQVSGKFGAACTTAYLGLVH